MTEQERAAARDLMRVKMAFKQRGLRVERARICAHTSGVGLWFLRTIDGAIVRPGSYQMASLPSTKPVARILQIFPALADCGRTIAELQKAVNLQPGAPMRKNLFCGD